MKLLLSCIAALLLVGCGGTLPTAARQILPEADTTHYVEINDRTDMTAIVYSEGTSVHLAIREAVWCHSTYTRIRVAVDGLNGVWTGYSGQYPATVDLTQGGYTTWTNAETLFVAVNVDVNVSVPCEPFSNYYYTYALIPVTLPQ